MKVLSFVCPRVIANGGGLTTAGMFPYTYGVGVVPLCDPVSGSVHVVPLVLERNTSILIL